MLPRIEQQHAPVPVGSSDQAAQFRGSRFAPLEQGQPALPLTGVKRSASGRLSGRQRPDADEERWRGGATATRQRGSGFGRSHDRPPAGDSLREFVLHSLRLRPSTHSGRGLPTRHSLRERRLPLDVRRHTGPSGLTRQWNSAGSKYHLDWSRDALGRHQTSSQAPPSSVSIRTQFRSVSIHAH